GENLLFLLMTVFSQEIQPPQNPGRFIIDFTIQIKLGVRRPPKPHLVIELITIHSLTVYRISTVYLEMKIPLLN
ncbi:hypothetical protein, partial [Alcaligenes aquatilis]|uniref:hypothetical protein n=1 Tax=Alcaligenes aquatilis TaxID=323284 RepID=UPI003D1C2D1B